LTKRNRARRIGIKTPIKGPKPDPADQTYNHIQACLSAPAERANALFKGFKALRRDTLAPSTVTKVVATALVILNLSNTTPDEKNSFCR